MQITPIKTKIFSENENLLKFLLQYLKRIPKRILKGLFWLSLPRLWLYLKERTAEYKNQSEKAKLIKQESDFAIKTKLTWLTVKDGMFMASAGIDESNAKDKLIFYQR